MDGGKRCGEDRDSKRNSHKYRQAGTRTDNREDRKLDRVWGSGRQTKGHSLGERDYRLRN